MSISISCNQCGQRVDMPRATFFLSIDMLCWFIFWWSYQRMSIKKLQCGRISINIDDAHRLFWHIFASRLRILCIFSSFPHICLTRSVLRTITNLKMPQTNYIECNLFIMHRNTEINNWITLFQFSFYFCKKKTKKKNLGCLCQDTDG